MPVTALMWPQGVVHTGMGRKLLDRVAFLCIMIFWKSNFFENMKSRLCLLSSIAAASVAVSAWAQQAPYKGYQPAVFAVKSNPTVPLKVTFCGDTVDLDRIDMFERLDRELTSVVYAHTSTLLCLKRANRYFPALDSILKANGVPADFLYLACTESTMDHNAYSPAHAAGLWQLLAATARQFGLEVDGEVDERYDPEKSTVAACRYLKSAYRKYGHWATVAASYNAGMGRISSELEKQLATNSFDLYLNSETSRYVFRIIAYKMLFADPRRFGYKLTSDQLYQPVRYTTVDVAGAVPSWAQWAKDHGVSYAQLREANPWIRASHLTNARGKHYAVRIPVADDLYRTRRSCTAYSRQWVVD